MSDDDCPALVSAKVPVTILTGFLGSGKTTLLHYILSADHGLKIAVVVNEFEFGKSIEKGLTVKSSEKSDDEWVELANGCMCCTSQSQSVVALENLMRRKTSFDLVLVETAGMADPGPVAAMFWQDESLCGMLYLSGILTLVDAKLIGSHLKDPEFAQQASRQLLVADRIILNKMDLVSEAERDEALAAVGAVNPHAEIVTSCFSRVPNVRELLFLSTTQTFDTESLAPDHNHGSVTSHSIEVEGVCASTRDIDFLCRDLLYHDTDAFEVVRMKAVVWVQSPDGPRPMQLQAICQLFDVLPMAGAAVPPQCNRFLILGRRLNEDHLRTVISSFVK